MKNSTLEQTQRIGNSKGKRRVCLWHRAMIDAGFPIGQPISIKVSTGGKVTIRPVDESRKRVSRVVNHGNVLPVIDLKETKTISLASVGEVGDEVRVRIASNLITITPNH